MLIEAVRDVGWLDMALYNWPWTVLAAIVIFYFVIALINWLAGLNLKGTALPQFFYDEEEDAYYYIADDGESYWVTADQPELPADFYYDEEGGRFFQEASDGELSYVAPEVIPGSERFKGRTVIIVPLGILIVGGIITIFINDWATDGRLDPRGQSQSLVVLYFEDEELKDRTISYFPGDQYQNREGIIFDLPFRAASEASDEASNETSSEDDSEDEDGARPQYGLDVTFNDTDRAMRIHHYQYEQFAGMCGGYADGELLAVLLPDLVIPDLVTLPREEYRGAGPPGSIDSYGPGCSTIEYLVIEADPYDADSYPYSPEQAASINAARRSSD